jgi:Tfp pilus assembly protein PilV
MNRTRAGQRGFTLLSVLVSIVIMAVGLLGMIRAMLAVTSSATQNQTVSAIATLSNGFWGVVQSNPALLVAAGFVGTYTASNYTGAPSVLQPWLKQATDALPAGQVTIATGPDAGSNSACTATSGCSVTMTMQWSQVGAPGANATETNRLQTFYYQFGL